MQKTSPDLHELSFALDAVSKASQIARAVQAEMAIPTSVIKADRSPVTVADLAVQALIAYFLEKAFPHDPLVAEEDSQLLKPPEAQSLLEQVTNYVRRFIADATPENVCHWIDRGTGSVTQRYWTLDPIDGTKGFLRGDQYAIALALVVDGKVRLGVLGCPNLKDAREPSPGGPGSLVFSHRGEGSWTLPLHGAGSKKSLRVSSKTNSTDAVLLRSLDTNHTNADEVNTLCQTLGIQTPPLLMDSLAKFSVLSAGGADLFFRLLSPTQRDYREYIWDQAAGTVILEEAGGRITDLDGKALDFTLGRKLIHNRGILASNGHLHGAALDTLRELKI